MGRVDDCGGFRRFVVLPIYIFKFRPTIEAQEYFTLLKNQLLSVFTRDVNTEKITDRVEGLSRKIELGNELWPEKTRSGRPVKMKLKKITRTSARLKNPNTNHGLFEIPIHVPRKFFQKTLSKILSFFEINFT